MASITSIIFIGIGVVSVGIVGYYTYNLLTEDSPSGQLARARLGLDRSPGANLLQDPKTIGLKPPSSPFAPGYVNKTKSLIEDPNTPQYSKDLFKQFEKTRAEKYFGKGTFDNNPSQQQEVLTQTSDDNIFKLYENPNYGIQIQYRSNWRIYVSNYPGEIFHTDDIVSFLAPVTSSEADRPSLIISAYNRPSYLNLNLSGYLAKVTKGYDSIYIDFKVIESNTNSILAGKPAYKLVFTNVKHDINFKSTEIGTIIGNKVYTVTYTAEEEEYSVYLPTIQKMIDSLKITTSNN
jgi:hypothetical protein